MGQWAIFSYSCIGKYLVVAQDGVSLAYGNSSEEGALVRESEQPVLTELDMGAQPSEGYWEESL